MAGRGRRKKLKLRSETIIDNRRDLNGQAEDKHTHVTLPDDLWGKILSKLTLKDNIRSSGVSKRFLAIATSVQKANKPPWLMLRPEFGDSYEFYDPLKCKSYWIELPELRDARIIHSKYGWLVMSNPKTLSLFLFCPYTRELIKLPSLSKEIDKVTFSAAPTSPNCMVFSFYCGEPEQHDPQFETFEVITCRPGEPEWTDVHYPFRNYPSRTCVNNMLFANGLLYCFCFPYQVVIFNPEKGSWSVKHDTKLSYPKRFWCNKVTYVEEEFMVELDGDIFVVFACTHTSPIIHKLDLPNEKWVQVETLGGKTVFINFLSSHGRTDLLGNMRNSIYFPEVQFHGKKCLSYSLDQGRHLPGKLRFNWREHWREDKEYDIIWIDAPEDLSLVL